MTIESTAGTKIAIGALPVTLDLAGFQAVPDFATIGEVTDLGAFGRVYVKIVHQPIDGEADQKFKGGFDNGAQNLQLALDAADVGQIAAEAASLVKNGFSFRLRSLETGLDVFYTGKVFSFTNELGARDTLRAGTINVEIDFGFIRT